ncbi:MAG: DNA polymerase I [Thermodesulfobacteriota bacterium]
MSLAQRLNLAQPAYLVDGSSFLYRAYYAHPDLKRADGFPTSVLHIVLRLLFRLLREERPARLAFILDGKGPTFRHELYPEYKAQRPPAPEGLVAQIEPLKEGVRLLGLPLLVSAGCEADDIMASLADGFKAERPVVLVGSDKDLKQCLDERVVLWDPGAKTDKVSTLADFRSETGLDPGQWPDFQALTGDSSDNIPGAPGVGPKTALSIMAEHPSLEHLRDHLDRLKPALRDRISAHIDALFTYRQLTRLRTDLIPAGVRLDDLAPGPVQAGRLAAFLEEYGLRQVQREFRELLPALAGAVAPEPAAGKAGKPKTVEQFSLLAPPASPGQGEPAREAASAADLPDPAGRAAGLVPQDGTVLVAAGSDPEDEWRCRCAAADLAARLAGADLLAVPSWKALLAADPAWDALPEARVMDLGLAAYLLDPEQRSYDLEHVLRRLGPELLAAAPPGQARAARDLGAALPARLTAAGLLDLYRDLELPLARVLVDMERAGLPIDRAAFAAFLAEAEQGLADLTARIYAQAGGEFNLRSSQQMAEVLFNRLGLKPRGRTGGGALSTAVEVLEKLSAEHPMVADILEFRKLEKLRSTYLEPLPRLAGEDGRIHTTFHQTATATGRLSSSDPNLQNIPIRGDLGKRMRACFRAPEGRLLVSADYSQVELRVLAHFSGEPALVNAFTRGEDIHARTAALLHDKEPAEVTPDERRGAKTINFGLIYGMGPQKLAQELAIPLKEAKAFIERYFERLSGLKAFYESVERHTVETGHVTTLAGRRRLLPDITSRNDNLRAQARRQAVNTLIQGSAADVIKLAMLAAHRDPELARLGARLILQVHDELLLEAPADTAPAAAARLASLMAGVADLKVPLVADHGVGATWAEAH